MNKELKTDEASKCTQYSAIFTMTMYRNEKYSVVPFPRRKTKTHFGEIWKDVYRLR